MRQVVGRATRELSAEAFTALRGAHDGLVLDVGTGDGKHALRVARDHPRLLVVGLDAGPDAMRPTAATAARKPARGGAANALFVWAAVEALPPALTGVTELHVLMPWGSLLRAMITPGVGVLRALAATCRPGARFLLTLNLHAWRPPVAEVGASDEPTPLSALGPLAAAYGDCGWLIEDAHHADEAELAALGTSWTRRLGSSRERLAVLVLQGQIPGGPDRPH